MERYLNTLSQVHSGHTIGAWMLWKLPVLALATEQ